MHPDDLASQLATHMTAHGIKPTANRIMVAKAIADAHKPLSLADIENLLDTVDKSSIFRTLTLFREAELVHTIEDETGALHFEICHGHGPEDCHGHRHFEDDSDLHVHFFCRVCHETTCLPSIAIPVVPLPDGYEAASATFIIKGVCPKCAKRG